MSARTPARPYPDAMAAIGSGRAHTGGPSAPSPLDQRRQREEQIIEHLFAVVDRLRAGFEAAVAGFDLSAAQAKALRFLAHAGPVPMRDLAVQLRCDASNVTGIVDRLEQRGLVERRAAPADRRVKSLVITSAGSQLAREIWLNVMDGAVGVVGLAEDEEIQLLVLLRRLDHGPGGHCWLSHGSAGCSAAHQP
ncbi:MAG: MarR family winged helix-turn-helix transcriptional regulator [Acidimicrobiales bacterium]